MCCIPNKIFESLAFTVHVFYVWIWFIINCYLWMYQYVVKWRLCIALWRLVTIKYMIAENAYEIDLSMHICLIWCPLPLPTPCSIVSARCIKHTWIPDRSGGFCVEKQMNMRNAQQLVNIKFTRNFLLKSKSSAISHSLHVHCATLLRGWMTYRVQFDIWIHLCIVWTAYGGGGRRGAHFYVLLYDCSTLRKNLLKSIDCN